MQRKLLTNGNAFKRTDGRWCGVVWYMDEHGERKHKSFSGTTKAEVNKKITDYLADFDKQAIESDESRKALRESIQQWLQVFKFPSVEQTTYDRSECSAKNQIYPLIGEKAVGDITAAYILMLNTGLRTGELLGLLNSDIDLDSKTLTVRQGVKEVSRRNGTEFTSGREIKIGKPKSATSKRTVPLNRTAIEMIEIYARKPISGKIRPLCATRKVITQNLSICEKDFTAY